jgi:TPP-dependent indolepyruvate ferredoxin oxidoreductase alpha subunit
MVKTVLDNTFYYSDHVAVMYEEFKKSIMSQLDSDISQVGGNIENWKEVEEIQEFSKTWEEKLRITKQQSDETNFYKDTWEKISKFNKIIEEKLPTSYAKLGTIMLETNTLRKILQEMPKKIQESIRSNVT